jgi:hypothetical protein
VTDTDSPERSPLVVGLDLPTEKEGRMGGPHLAPERKDGGEALLLAGGGADAGGATARETVERRANLASGVAGAEDGEGQGSCAATRARRQSMAGSGWARGFSWCRTCRG